MKTLAEATLKWNRPGTFVLMFSLSVCLLCQNVSRAQEPAASQSNQSNLSDKQEAISQQFKRFESTLHDLGEYMKKTDPARADLLFRAFGQSKQNQMTVEMQQVLQMTLLGNANVEDRKIFPSLFNEVFGLQEEKEEIMELTENLF